MKPAGTSPIIGFNDVDRTSVEDLLEDPGCIYCGKHSSRQTVCPSCLTRSTRSPLSLIDLPYLLTVLSIIFSFIIITGGEFLPSNLSSSLEGMKEMGFLFLTMSIVASFLFITESRLHVLNANNIRSTSTILMTCIASLSLVPLLTMGLGPFQVLLPILLISASLILLVPKVRELYRTFGMDFVLFILGSVLIVVGLSLLLSNIDTSLLFWFISGEHIVLLGLIVLIASTYRICSEMNAGIRRTLSLVSLALSTTVMLFTGLAVFMGGQKGSFDEMFLTISLLLLSISVSSRINIKTKDVLMRSAIKQISESMERADKFRIEGRNYYALQQYDRALSLNPIHEMGLPFEESRIITKLERNIARFELSFQPSEYEVSYNEKAKILSSQGRFTEAVSKYKESIKKRPDYIQTYLELAMVLSSIPGRSKESREHLRFFITSKVIYLRRLYDLDVTSDMLWWLTKSFEMYLSTLQYKTELLSTMSRDGDVWAYFSLGKD